MAISKVGLGWAVGERNYDTLTQWDAAKRTSGEFEEAHCKGLVGSGSALNIFLFANGALIRGDVTFDGANKDSLARLEHRLLLSTASGALGVRVQDLFITSSDTTTIQASNNSSIVRCYAESNGGSGSGSAPINLISGGRAENCIAHRVTTSTNYGIISRTGCTAINCISTSANRGFYVQGAVTNCLSFNSSVVDYESVGGTKTNCASQDATGNYTGYTSAELVDFAGGDYRIKSTSDLKALGIGAFFEEASGAVVSTVATTWPLFQVAASQQSTAPAVYNSTVALTWPMFAVSANQQSAVPVYESAVTVAWPLFQVSAAQSGEAPTVASSVAFDWPLFQVSATQQSSVPVYNSAVDVTWPLFSVSAAQTSVAPDGATINVTWPLFQVSVTQSSTVPVYTASASVEWPLFSVYVDAREVTPEPELDLPISGYGNNRTWFDSVFFRPNR